MICRTPTNIVISVCFGIFLTLQSHLGGHLCSSHTKLMVFVDSDGDSDDDPLNSSTSSISKLRLLLRRQDENRGSTRVDC